MAHLLSDAHWLNWLAKVFIQFVAPNIFTPQILLFFLLCFFFMYYCCCCQTTRFMFKFISQHFRIVQWKHFKAEKFDIWPSVLSQVTVSYIPPLQFFFPNNPFFIWCFKFFTEQACFWKLFYIRSKAVLNCFTYKSSHLRTIVVYIVDTQA